MSYILSSGTTVTTNAVGSYANGDTVSATFAAPTDNTTYEVVLTAENADGETDSLSLGTIYGGTLALTKVSDAAENGLVPGVFRITRADTAHDLVVTYTVGGTATPGQTYEALSGTNVWPDSTWPQQVPW